MILDKLVLRSAPHVLRLSRYRYEVARRDTETPISLQKPYTRNLIARTLVTS